ncbi:hypothetical protein NDU88_002370 [Pleurodeles waltl]|uniref:Uncharacterized protein n=1 Tax=Pleurodeles waltl TaxID=8319 RepID=A0AAV7WNE2_PLEWA|nr:hypothetical protein NDU88_002370 [Pleurodeles waltl]
MITPVTGKALSTQPASAISSVVRTDQVSLCSVTTHRDGRNRGRSARLSPPPLLRGIPLRLAQRDPGTTEEASDEVGMHCRPPEMSLADKEEMTQVDFPSPAGREGGGSGVGLAGRIRAPGAGEVAAVLDRTKETLHCIDFAACEALNNENK